MAWSVGTVGTLSLGHLRLAKNVAVRRQTPSKTLAPGVSNAWTMPIKAHIHMLSTGIRTPVGVKVIGRSDRDRSDRQADRAGSHGGARNLAICPWASSRS